MLSAMDDAVGAVLTKLRHARIDQETLIFFLSDNGGPTRQTSSRNDPLRGFKGQVLEGGIRIPFLIQWKGHLPAGMVCKQPVISLDILPTAVAAAGIELSSGAKLDGVNLMAHLNREKSGPPHEALYWRFGEQSAIRKGDWKLVKIGAEPLQLFDLARDIGETTDQASRRPDVVKELDSALKRWDARLAKPLWQRAG
jgi:arylsulfatase A-like enzyme